MQNPSLTLPIITIGCAEIQQNELEGWREHIHINTFRAIKKQFRHAKPALIVACIANSDDEQLSEQVTVFVREGLLNNDTRIILLQSPLYDLDQVNWIGTMQVNGCLLAEPSKRTFNLSILNREIDTFAHIEDNRRQHEAETNMLMCISQFSRGTESVADLLKAFSSSLTALCYSSCCLHIKIQAHDQGHISYCDYEKSDLVDNFNQVLGLPALPDYLKKTLDEQQPQINLLPEEINLDRIEQKLGEKIGSYLTFPIVAYNKTLYLLMYFVSQEQMDKVSMKQINVINKASEQLTLLLERRQAEYSLKRQYKRLKETLVDLKTAKQELQHKEKMASIGQMAAGIAHEINNPLAYVMTNFTCMDEYLKSIMQLQGLQSEFLASIDIGRDQKITELRNNISKFEKDEGMAFILEDIRSVIAESHSGLKRVRDIITDLKSFTYSQSTELEVCDLTQVIDDTLKLLSYDLDDTIKVEKNLEDLPTFMAHNGLMQQVFTNLIKNAAQALSEAKIISPKICINTQSKNGSIYITVRDNGPGIPESAREKIFEPFYTTKTVGEGTGLGLSVTFNIIKKLAGTITLDSELGKFTQFTMIFPISAHS
ncbi:ATP-binding protein [Paraglaciecola sp. 20A4]|uniref:sensor histidine kinase n=1 Tax=Paraglaciecola sp. 20A4 TaxID=2687288 RepID=UPI00140AE81A|nr:ATP-binding protein [Paraglaciecola sp. 20A4]